LSLILTGAIGNIVDSLFYGVLFNESTMTQVATLFPDKGYASLFHGRVVDMFYFPIFRGYLPDWMPFVNGRYMEFFPYIFNFADAFITVGVFLVLIFQGRFFKED
jgi:signal peptidase II